MSTSHVFTNSESTKKFHDFKLKGSKVPSLYLEMHNYVDYYLAHVIEQPNFRIPNPQYFVYLLDQTVGQDILQFIY